MILNCHYEIKFSTRQKIRMHISGISPIHVLSILLSRTDMKSIGIIRSSNALTNK